MGHFLKIYVTLPKYVNHLKQHFEKETIHYNGKSGVFSEVTFESNVSNSLRFMIDTKLTGMSWVKIKRGLYKIREDNKMSTC